MNVIISYDTETKSASDFFKYQITADLIDRFSQCKVIKWSFTPCTTSMVCFCSLFNDINWPSQNILPNWICIRISICSLTKEHWLVLLQNNVAMIKFTVALPQLSIGIRIKWGNSWFVFSPAKLLRRFAVVMYLIEAFELSRDLLNSFFVLKCGAEGGLVEDDIEKCVSSGRGAEYCDHFHTLFQDARNKRTQSEAESTKVIEE